MIVLIGVSGINHLIGHILMMQCFPSISCFDSGSIAHFRPESVQRFICFNQIERCTRGTSVLVSIGDSVKNHVIGHNLMMQMFSFNFRF